jgi:hypothetical protein
MCPRSTSACRFLPVRHGSRYIWCRNQLRHASHTKMNTTSMMMAMICGHRPGNRRRLCSSGTRMRPTAERTWNAHREGSVHFFSYYRE